MAVGAYEMRVEFPGSKSHGCQENLQPTSTHGQLTANLRERSRKVLSRFYYKSACLSSLQNCHSRGHRPGDFLWVESRARPLGYSELSSAPHLDSRKPRWDYQKRGIISSAVFCKTRVGGLGDRPPGDAWKEPGSSNRKQELLATWSTCV